MDLDMDTLCGDEFAPELTYLNTSKTGLLPRRAVAAIQALAEEKAAGRATGGDTGFEVVDAARASFGRLVSVPEGRVAVGSSVAVHTAVIAASLPPGAEVLIPEGEFSSLVHPFVVRDELRTRYVPLEKLARSIRPDTALVAFSAVQSADGRTADLAGVREAAAAQGARTLVDTTQSAGWLPLDAGTFDYTVTAGYKFLLCPHGTAFLTVTEEAQRELRPVHAGWVAGEDPWVSTYGPIGELAHSARRFDEPMAFLAYHGAEQSLALLEKVGVEALHTHGTALADRFRAGLNRLGLPPVDSDSVVVAVPGLGHREPDLRSAGVDVSVRAGNLRVSFHLYNSTADVDRALDVLAG